MSTEKKFNPSITFHHVIAFSLIVSALILYPMKQYTKNGPLDEVISSEGINIRRLFGRILDFKEDVNEVCLMGDEKLRDYYKTADLSLIDLGKKDKKDEDSDKDPDKKTEAIINLVAQEGKTGDNAKTYLLSIIPILLFFVFAILAIPGWIVCCGCCCCNCCCYCCCKKPCCRFPFLIVALACNAVIIISCIYGLAQSNNIFEGIANTECALLKFIEEIQGGETRKTAPRWGGFDEIKGSFNVLKENVKKINSQTTTKLESGKGEIANSKKNFVEKFNDNTSANTICKFVNKKRGEVASDRSKIVFDRGSDKIWLNIYESFGECDDENNHNEKSFYKLLSREYTEVARQSDEYLGEAINKFKKVMETDAETGESPINSALSTAESGIKEIEGPINDIKDSFAGNIIIYSKKIDKYGKTGFKVVFSVLTVLDAAIVALIIIYFLFGTTLCLNHRCLRCLNKVFIHILWNILALLMIITFLLGAIFTLVGKIGNDLMPVVSYLIGEKNLSKKENALLLSSAAKYLDVCFNGDGKLSRVLDLGKGEDDPTKSLQSLNDLSKQINDLRGKFEPLQNSYAVNFYFNNIKGAMDYDPERILFNIQGQPYSNVDDYIFNNLLTNLNNKLGNIIYKLDCNEAEDASCKNPKKKFN